MITPVIMAGGSGTRLWPLSRAGHPKRFLAFNGEKTMLHQTAERVSGLPTTESITICNGEHRFFVAEQLREIDGFQSWGEDILEVTMVQWDSYLREDKVARFRDRRWPAAETGSTEGLVKLTS